MLTVQGPELVMKLPDRHITSHCSRPVPQDYWDLWWDDRQLGCQTGSCRLLLRPAPQPGMRIWHVNLKAWLMQHKTFDDCFWQEVLTVCLACLKSARWHCIRAMAHHIGTVARCIHNRLISSSTNSQRPCSTDILGCVQLNVETCKALITS